MTTLSPNPGGGPKLETPDWPSVKLRRLASVVSTKATEKTFELGLEDIESWTGRLVTGESTYEAAGVAFEKDDVLFGKLRPYLAKAYQAEQQGQAVGDFIVLRPSRNVHPRFLTYNLLEQRLIDRVTAGAYGSKMPRTNWDDLGSQPILLPPFEEQCRIAAFLDHETARIDELVREQERLQSLLAEKRDEVIGRAVREGLDGEESIPIGDVFIRSAPKSWQVSPLRRFLKHVSPRAVGEAWRDYTLLSLTRQGIIERDIDSGIGKFPAEFNGYQRVEPGQVVFCLFDIDETPRTVGYSDKRGMITSAYAVFEPTEYGNGEFISYYFQYVDTYKGLRPFYSGLRKTIRPNNFLGVRVAIPEVSEQERIVRFLDAELEKLDRLAEVAQRNIDLLLERRSALISAAVTGHLDLRDWQPSAPERVAEVA